MPDLSDMSEFRLYVIKAILKSEKEKLLLVIFLNMMYRVNIK